MVCVWYVVDDTLDSILGGSDDEAEEDAVISQVLDEIGIEVSSKVSLIPLPHMPHALPPHATCIAPHALPHMHCPTCIAPHALPHMHCPTCIVRLYTLLISVLACWSGCV